MQLHNHLKDFLNQADCFLRLNLSFSLQSSTKRESTDAAFNRKTSFFKNFDIKLNVINQKALKVRRVKPSLPTSNRKAKAKTEKTSCLHLSLFLLQLLFNQQVSYSYLQLFYRCFVSFNE